MASNADDKSRLAKSGAGLSMGEVELGPEPEPLSPATLRMIAGLTGREQGRDAIATTPRWVPDFESLMDSNTHHSHAALYHSNYGHEELTSWYSGGVGCRQRHLSDASDPDSNAASTPSLRASSPSAIPDGFSISSTNEQQVPYRSNGAEPAQFSLASPVPSQPEGHPGDPLTRNGYGQDYFEPSPREEEAVTQSTDARGTDRDISDVPRAVEQMVPDGAAAKARPDNVQDPQRRWPQAVRKPDGPRSRES